MFREVLIPSLEVYATGPLEEPGCAHQHVLLETLDVDLEERWTFIRQECVEGYERDRDGGPGALPHRVQVIIAHVREPDPTAVGPHRDLCHTHVLQPVQLDVLAQEVGGPRVSLNSRDPARVPHDESPLDRQMPDVCADIHARVARAQYRPEDLGVEVAIVWIDPQRHRQGRGVEAERVPLTPDLHHPPETRVACQAGQEEARRSRLL